MVTREEFAKSLIRKEIYNVENGLSQSELKRVLESRGLAMKDSEVSNCIDSLENEAAIYVRRVGVSRLILPNHRLLHHSLERSIISKKFKDKLYKMFLIQNKFSKSLVLSEIKFDPYINEYLTKNSVTIDIEDLENVTDFLSMVNTLVKSEKKDKEGV